MNDLDANRWLETVLNVPRETMDALGRLNRATIAANERQNLISRTTIESFWARHIVDSAQLIPLAADSEGDWLDLGSGAGFPGLVIALLTNRHVTLIDERRKRIEHLTEMVALLGLEDRASVVHGRVERQPARSYSIISARAFAPLDRLFSVAHHLSSPETLWLLPKGRSATSELEAARRTWQGRFRIEPSVTDPDGAIIIATGVEPRRRR